MGNQAFELAILISLKDAASGGADRVGDRLRAMGKEGRAALKTFEDLRKDLRQGLTLGGIGVAGLATMWKGVRTAGDFQAAVTELKLSIEEIGSDGQMDLAKLNDQLNRSEQLAVRLGNKLPGTTEDFIEMITVLKQGGLDMETVLKGAGEQVAYLSVLTNSLPKDLAKDFASLGLQFQLKPEDFAPSTDRFLKMYRAVGLHPSELIEGTKFAELRAGLPLGLKGMKGLETMSTLLASLKAVGLEGGVGGRELGALLLGLVPHGKEQMKAEGELAKRGIKLEFFDKKGQFLGDKNLIEQLSKLNKLSPEEKQSILKTRFNESAMGPLVALAEQGAAGYEKLQKKMAVIPSTQDQINQKMEDFNANLESLQGTLENLKVTAFSPMLETVTPLVSDVNEIVGSIQQWAKENPGIAKFAGNLLGIGSATLIVVGGFKAMRAAWGMWKIVSAVSSGESGLIAYLKGVQIETDKTAEKVGNSSKWKQAGSRLGSSLMGAIKGVIIAYGIERILASQLEKADWEVRARQGKIKIEDLIAERAKLMGEIAGGKVSPSESGQKLQLLETQIGEAKIETSRALQTKGGTFSYTSEMYDALMQATHGAWGSTFTSGLGIEKALDETFRSTNNAQARVVQQLQGLHFETATQLQGYLDGIRKSGKLKDDEIAKLNELANQAYPQYRDQLEQLRAGTVDYMSTLKSLRESTESASAALQNLANTPTDASKNSGGGGGVKPAPSINWSDIPSKASGGRVLRGGLVRIHDNEEIVPARVTSRYEERGRVAAASAGHRIHVEAPIHLHPPAGSAMANDPEAFGEYASERIVYATKRLLERN